MKSLTQYRIRKVATFVLSVVLYCLILGSAQEIYETLLHGTSGPGIIRLLTIEVGGACRIALAATLGPRKTLIPEIILFVENTIQLLQYAHYEL